MSLKSLFGCASLLALGAFCSSAPAQSVPITFAGTLAGGGTVCSTSIPVYAYGGVAGGSYGDGCPATQATLNVPVAATADQYGNVFIADQTYQLVRVVYNGGAALAAAITASNILTPNIVPQKGYIYTIAGGETKNTGATYCNQAAGSGSKGINSGQDSCAGTETEEGPRGLTVDADGNLFIASVSPSSEIRVFYVGGTAAANLIKLENPTITTPQPGFVYLIAGANSSAYTGDGALASKAAMNTPRGIWVDANENVYFADNFNFAIRRVDSTTGFISTVAGHNAGSATSCSTATSTGDSGSATAATAIIACPYGVAFDTNGNMFIAEAGNGGTVPGKVRVVYAGGTLPGIASPVVGNIYTYAGGASGTTQAQLTTFQEVFGVSLDPAGALYVTDYRTASTGSNHVWRVDPSSGNIAIIAGNSGTAALTTGAYCNGGATGPKTTDTRGDGCPATQAYLNLPQESFTWTPSGTFYIADRGNNVVRSFTFNNLFPASAVGSNVTEPLAFLYATGSLPTTETFTNQGVTSADYSDAGGDTCALNTTLPAATTCVDYVKFAPSAAGVRPGSITVSSATATVATQTLVGTGLAPVLAIDPGTTGTLGSGLSATAVSVDEFGNVYVSDATSKSVLKGTTALTTFTQLTDAPGQTAIDPYGDVFVADPGSNKIVEVLTAAKGGSATSFGTGLSGPQGVAADQLGNIYVADTGNNRLLYLSPATGNQVPFPVSGFTLSAPTSLATDSAGDLFIVDSGSRVIEVPMGASPIALTLPSGTLPTGISVDPAGDLYIADKTTTSVLYIPAGTTTATGLVTGLKTPVGVAVNPAGSVYVADSGATTIVTDNRALNTSVFPTTNVQLTSLPVTLTLENVGNASATLATPPFVETGTAAAFPASSASTTCAAAGVIAAGGNCTQSFVFQPTTPGAQSAKAVFSTTTGQSVTANFSATATNLILTTTSLKLSNTGTIYYGQTANYTVTMTPASTGSSTPTGNIAVVVDGKTTTTVPVSSSPYSFQLMLSVGTHSVAATYTGDAIYAASNTTTTITIVKSTTTTTVASSQTAAGTVLTATVTPISTGASPMTGNVTFYVDGSVAATAPVGTGTVSVTVLVTDGSHTFYAVYAGDGNYAGSQSTTQTLVIARTPTTTTLTITPVANGTGSAFALAAKVTPSTGTGTPSGTVTFTNNGVTLGSVNLSTAVNGVVTFTTTTTTYTNYTFTATYSGDGLFQPSSGSATEGATFVVIPPSAGITVLAGGQTATTVYTTSAATTSLVINSIQGYTGTLTATCTGMPVDSICRFTPSTFPLGSTGTANPLLEVFTGVNPNVASVEAPQNFGKRSETVLALALLAPLAFAFRRRRGVLPGLLAIAVMVALGSLTGCGNKTPASSTGFFVTPVGTYTPTIVVTDTNGVSNSSTFTLTVLPPVNQ